jgi:hypothetical protein
MSPNRTHASSPRPNLADMLELPDDSSLDSGLHPEAQIDPGGPTAELLVAAPDGPHALGPATVDSDADGRADTAVVAGPDALELGTDVDGDGRVDVLTRVLADGTATTATTPGLPGEGWDEGPAPLAPTIDPVTGRWVRGG